MRGNPEFKLGEEVKISRPELCHWGCTSSMERMKDKVGTIRSVRWSESANRWAYSISGDRLGYTWSANCFESTRYVCELPEFIPADEDTVQNLFM